MRDDRLSILFCKNRVRFHWPEDSKRWFEILVLHQNRVKHWKGDYISESFQPAELDLVVWEHERECFTDTQFNGRFHVIQSGSTVATTSHYSELANKYVGKPRAESKGDNKKINCFEPVLLSTVRQLFVKDIVLPQMLPENDQIRDQLVRFVEQHIENIIKKATGMGRGHLKQPLKLLIRLRVYYGPDHETFCIKDKVANSGDCLQFVRNKMLWSQQIGKDHID